MKRNLSIIITLALIVCQSHAQGLIRKTEKSLLLTDPRDGQIYETVMYTTTYPDQTHTSTTWMAANLNYDTNDSFCYDDESNCETYGRLYTWKAAMAACPKGWKLPGDEDWYRLSFHFGGNCSSGRALKSDSNLWRNESQRGTNESHFNALPAGLGGGNGGYFGLGRSAIFWSATGRDETTTWDWKFIRDSELQRWYGGKAAKHCVRCVKE